MSVCKLIEITIFGIVLSMGIACMLLLVSTLLYIRAMSTNRFLQCMFFNKHEWKEIDKYLPGICYCEHCHSIDYTDRVKNE